MKPVYLFPNKLKIPALITFICSLILIMLQFNGIEYIINAKVYAIASDHFLNSEENVYLGWVTENIYNEILDILYFSSGIILIFSKEKIEDEMIRMIRYQSLVYSSYFIFSMLILSEIFIYGMSFLPVIMFFFYAFVLFLNIFYYSKLFIYKKQFSYENED